MGPRKFFRVDSDMFGENHSRESNVQTEVGNVLMAIILEGKLRSRASGTLFLSLPDAEVRSTGRTFRTFKLDRMLFFFVIYLFILAF